MNTRTIGILGLGTFGASIVKQLSLYDCDIIAMDNREESINHLEPYLTKGIIGDITDRSLLRAAGIDTCEVVVVATGTHLESSALAVMHCKTLGVPKIIAKAQSKTYMEVLKQIGATRVISPERETGVRLAKHIFHKQISDVIQLDDNISIIEFYPPKTWLNKTLSGLKLRQNYKLNLLGYRTQSDNNLNIQVGADYRFKEKELLVAMVDSETFNHFDELNTLD